MENLAFDFLRQFKTVESETEKLVLKKTAYKVNTQELLTIFENGISGKYGKLYSADPQTLMGWVAAYLKEKNSDRNYISAGLVDISIPSYENIEWDKEANKCFSAFLTGVNESNFHPAVYDRMMIDGKINLGSYLEVYDGPINTNPDNELQWRETMSAVNRAKQKVLKTVFMNYKLSGFSYVYFIRN